ncbi:MAG: rhomboid family intramembrane serine protease [Caulobacter sp.]|nr:rhomboid family intramembrane serine protease [Caulobacter sp.]
MTDDFRADPSRVADADRPAPAEGLLEALEADHARDQRTINVTWAESWALALVAGLIGLGYLWQLYMQHLSPNPDAEWLAVLSRHALAEGRWWTLFSAMFMHGGGFHLLMNLSALLPFGLIVGRRLGANLRGQLTFLAFYLGAGLAADLAFLLLTGPNTAVVGASGAIFGLWGAVVRLPRDRGVWPLFSRHTARQMAAPIIANVLVAVLFGLGAGMGQGEVAGIAWQAHLGGFLFGLLTIGFIVPRGRGRTTA